MVTNNRRQNQSGETILGETTPLLGNMTMRVTDSRTYLNEDGKHEGCWKRKSGMEQKLVILSVFLSALSIGLIIALAIEVTKDKGSSPTSPVTTTTLKPGTGSPPVDVSTALATDVPTDNTTGNSTDETNDPSEGTTGGGNTGGTTGTGGSTTGPGDSTTGPGDNPGTTTGIGSSPAGTTEQPTSTGVAASTASPLLCDRAECLAAGTYLTQNMDFTVDPCTDFYKYVCGKWELNAEMPDDKGRYGVFDELRDALATTCTVELKKQDGGASGSAAISVKNARALYQGCEATETSSDEDAQIQSLRGMLRTVSGPSWSQQMSKTINELGLSYIFSFGIGADVKDPTKNIIYLDQPGSFGLSRLTLIEGTSDDDKKKIAAYKTYIQSVYCFLDPPVVTDCETSPEAQAHAQKLIDYEITLAKLTRAPADRRNASSWYFPMKIAELDTNIPDINWLKLIGDSILGAGVTVTEETIVVVKEETYLKEVIEALKADTDLQKTAQDFMNIRTAMFVGPILSKKVRDRQFEFQKVVNGVKAPQKIEDRCFELANSYLSQAVGRLYVDAVGFDATTKSDMEEMVKHLSDSFKELLDANDWMDEETKNKARDKLAEMKDMIGFPDWTKDDAKLDAYYELADLTAEEFPAQLTKTMKQSTLTSIKKLNTPNDRNTWISSASIVNAFYSPSLNSITFPAGILQMPFYVHNGPKALNYGAIGYVIGHEITHGFDDSGRQYNGVGILEDWWTENTLTKFTKRKECFEQQYSAITDPLANMQLNGKQTIGENIADNGGIRQAYKAYMSSGREHIYLSSDVEEKLKTLNDAQLFFVGAASVWCTKFTQETIVSQIQDGVHSPGMYRAKIPLLNTDEFAEVFNCPVGSAMNPPAEERCRIW